MAKAGAASASARKTVRHEGPDLIPISLLPVVGTREGDTMEADAVMRIMPRGRQFFGGIEFLIEGVVNLDGSGSSAAGLEFRKCVVVSIATTNDSRGKAVLLDRGEDINCLHLVGATRYSTPVGESFAEIVWRYTDGTTSRSSLKYGVHLRNWHRNNFERPNQLTDPLVKVAWKQPHPSNKDRSVRLYRVTVVNPQPTRTIKELEFVGGLNQPGLILLALTLDRLKPSERADDLTHDEMPDPELPGMLKVFVQTTGGLPVANAEVGATARETTRRSIAATPSVTTDASGMAVVKFQTDKLGRLEVAATHEDYAGMRMVWDVTGGDHVPASYTLKLSPGITLGGTVVDETDYGLSGLKLDFYRFWTGDDDMNQKGEQFEFRSKTAMTDAVGAWQLKGVPEPILDRIGFRVEHADFVGVQVQLDNDAKAVKELRAGTHKLVLKRGLEAWGTVMDDKNQPIANAKVSGGRRYSTDFKETTTDARGQFYLKPLDEGEVTFTASANGFAPEIKKLRVERGMPPVYFKLSAGVSIRGIVVDESNVPVAGVQVTLERWGGPEPLPLEFSTTTKADGRFEWNSAPNKSLPFNFYKEGYSSQSDVLLEPGKDNVITLKPPVTVKGIVSDDATGQPVTTFRAGVGSSWSPGAFYNNHDGMKQFSSGTGEFELSVSAHYHDAIKVEADGYAEQIKNINKGGERVQTLTFRLKVARPLAGTVVDSQGSPIAGAQVAMASRGGPGNVHLDGKGLRANDSGSKIVTTSEDGRFQLGSPPEEGEYNVIAASSKGVGWATVAQVRASGMVVIQSNGRIEGTLKIAGQPAAGHGVLFTLYQQGIQTDFNRLRTTTDEAGKFTFEDVPSGEGSLVRLIQTEQNSWMHSHTTAVKVEPGQTTYVTLGDSGAVIRGRIRYETPPVQGMNVRVSGGLSTSMPAMPSFNSAAEAQAFTSSPEWKERMKAMKYFGFVIGGEGAFQVDSIPPGSYTLNINASKPKEGGLSWQMDMVAMGTLRVTVPDSATPYSPIEVGEVVLKALPTQSLAAPR